MFDLRYKRKHLHIKWQISNMSKSFLLADFINRVKKNSNTIFQFSYIDQILANHLNSKLLRRFLSLVLNDKTLTQIEHDLKRCLCIETSHVMFHLKKRYENLIDKSVKCEVSLSIASYKRGAEWMNIAPRVPDILIT